MNMKELPYCLEGAQLAQTDIPERLSIIPAPLNVIPTKAGIHRSQGLGDSLPWIPVFAGMTGGRSSAWWPTPGKFYI